MINLLRNIRLCSKCRQMKSINEFSKDRQKKDGLYSSCKVCQAAKNKKWFQITKERDRQKRTDIHRKWARNNKKYLSQYRKNRLEDDRETKSMWSKKNSDKCRMYSRKRRDLEKNSEFTLSDEKFIYSLFGNKCFNCGSVSSLEIDHHYPLSKGYPLNRKNAVLLCKSCNCSKSNKLPEEFYSSEKINELNILLEVINVC